ncbi:MAG: hypothetical protein HPY71_14575 [Firmicutes bacterium]|nr:hypothetical protein [Bacillota bacterium]
MKKMEAEILQALYYYGPLEYFQIVYYLARRGYPREDITVFDSLAKLVRMGAIYHISPWMPGSRKYERVYYLQMGRKARHLLEEVLQDTIIREFWWPATEIYRLRRKGYDLEDYLGRFQGKHERALRNFKLQLATSGGGELEFWRNDAFEFHRYKSSMRAIVRPDAIFAWRYFDPKYNIQPFYYFLELELSWKSDDRVKQRMENFIHFLVSNTWGKTKSGLELPYFPALLFLFPKNEGSTVKTGRANMRRHRKALYDAMTAIKPDLFRWEQVFSYGFCFADFCTGVLDRDNTVSPATDAIWYDYYHPERGPCTLREIVPSNIKELLEARYRRGMET